MQKRLASFCVLILAAAVAIGTAATLPATAMLPATQLQSQHSATPVDNAALDFVLVNNTGYDIAHLYISASSKDNWEEDLLGGEPLAAGESIEISFAPEESAAKWDLRADWLMEEGSESQEYVYWKGLNLTEISKMTLKYDKATDKTSAKLE